jgi:CBS domain-containing protein
VRIADLMSRSVLSVEEDTPLPRVVQLLIDHGISAVPVTRDGEPVGMISESDLITGGRRASMDRAAWFSLLIHGQGRQELQPIEGQVARDVMSAPVISVSEATDIAEAVRLMGLERIKRLPVTRAGKLVGIISRADLLRGLAHLPAAGSSTNPDAKGLFESIDAHYAQGHADTGVQAGSPAASATTLTAADFRQSVEAAQLHAQEAQRLARLQVQRQHQHEVEVARDAHISDSVWRSLLLNARHAAERGEVELQILRFPRELCSDGGRAIDNSEAGWETTLHGEAAELFRRWAIELRPRGFHMKARTLDYPNGFPGDIGLFLSW